MIIIAFSSFSQQPKTAAKSPTPNVKTPAKKTPPAGSKAYNAISGLNAQEVKDIDGNVYHTVIIGTQTWMVENLKTTRFNDGTAIPLVTYNSSWDYLQTPGYCWYNNDSINSKNVYGALYNWYAVGTSKLAPAGWHVATDIEWKTLNSYVLANLGKSGSVAKALAATTNWATSNKDVDGIGDDLTKNNSSGFSALPGGDRGGGTFSKIGEWGFWWSSTQTEATKAWCKSLCYYYWELDNTEYYKGVAMSIRCIKD